MKKTPWYLSSWLIGLMSSLWFFVIPGTIAIIQIVFKTLLDTDNNKIIKGKNLGTIEENKDKNVLYNWEQELRERETNLEQEEQKQVDITEENTHKIAELQSKENSLLNWEKELQNWEVNPEKEQQNTDTHAQKTARLNTELQRKQEQLLNWEQELRQRETNLEQEKQKLVEKKEENANRFTDLQNWEQEIQTREIKLEKEQPKSDGDTKEVTNPTESQRKHLQLFNWKQDLERKEEEIQKGQQHLYEKNQEIVNRTKDINEEKERLMNWEDMLQDRKEMIEKEENQQKNQESLHMNHGSHSIPKEESSVAEDNNPDRFQVVQVVQDQELHQGSDIPPNEEEEHPSSLVFDEERITSISAQAEELSSDYSAKTGSEIDETTEEDSANPGPSMPLFVAELTDAERTLLSKIAIKNGEALIPLEEATAHAENHGLMFGVFLSDLNDKSVNHFGEPILEIDGQEILLDEDYQAVLMKLEEETV
ncbi:hypothetical protein EPH95_05990 [Salicibibacter halophilus]|uniref:TerB-C domain-containing protein n=1 Tax=Salicibibacter halophilus TaxID=2502791 RepID=A0A514LFZ8_9BACI|nr:tellurite resistance TerB C-terminal domain-containing protein [Salicibibacter halophilus]QDI90784.1 hypothetical protein EPH95_05990 [Salicibibacter halophilus]